MRDRTLITTGAIGAVLAAICCLTPLLVIVFGAVGLTAWLAKVDYVLIPALILCLALVAFKRPFTEPIPKAREGSFAGQGIDAFHGMARFTGPDTVTVEGHALTGRSILIATGARPVPLGFPGAQHAITSDAFMELEHL